MKNKGMKFMNVTLAEIFEAYFIDSEDSMKIGLQKNSDRNIKQVINIVNIAWNKLNQAIDLPVQFAKPF